MRLGIKDMSILDALAHIYSKEFGEIIELVEQKVDGISKEYDGDITGLVDARKLLGKRRPTSIQVLETAIKDTKRDIKSQSSLNKDKALLYISGLEEDVPDLRNAVKATREVIESAYNVSSDIGIIAVKLKSGGIRGLDDIKITAGVPIRSMLAERLPSIEVILKKLGGECALEYKYDGLRLQLHITPNDVALFSRGLENMTPQFPDVVEAVKKTFKGRSGIFDSECIPLDPNTGDVLPFQYISRRARRKYGLSTSVKSETLDDHQVKGFEDKIPVCVVMFDCLSLDEENLTSMDYRPRREKLMDAFDFNSKVALAVQTEVSTLDAAQDFFTASIESGCEGIIAKSIAPGSVYKAGKRGFIWIKYKRDYRMELGDSLDLVVVGAFHGQGRRTGVYGAFLMATFDPEIDKFETICKLGTGFDDPTLKKLYDVLSEKVVAGKPEPLEIDPKMTPDVYFEPFLLLEVKGAEISYSPIHTCAKSKLKENFGLAVRFPRFTGRFRDDKTPEDATTTQEAISMYKSQSKQSQ